MKSKNDCLRESILCIMITDNAMIILSISNRRGHTCLTNNRDCLLKVDTFQYRLWNIKPLHGGFKLMCVSIYYHLTCVCVWIGSFFTLIINNLFLIFYVYKGSRSNLIIVYEGYRYNVCQRKISWVLESVTFSHLEIHHWTARCSPP